MRSAERKSTMARLLVKEVVDRINVESGTGKKTWTISTLAEAVGVAHATIAKMMHGHNVFIDLNILERVAQVLDVSICELIESDTKQKRKR
jgi:DNA-binding Xre family transcriptional regulator